MKKNLSRRKFLGEFSCKALGYTSLMSSLINLKSLNAAAISNSDSGGDYKALVCLFKSGGNDSFNMLIPTQANEYADYVTTRSNLALAKEEILNLNFSDGGRTFGIHPSMQPLQNLFNNNKLAFVSNVGTLIEPITKSRYFNDQDKLPLGLYSHADQIQQWQTAFPHERAVKGWGGRIADLVQDQNANKKISMNFSLSGSNIFQTGNNGFEYVLDPYEGSIGIFGYGVDNEYDVFNKMRTKAIDSLIDHQYNDIFKQTYVDVIKTARNGHIDFQTALQSAPEIQTEFSDNYLSASFSMAARTISAQKELGMSRQIFFIDFGGWDHHDEVLMNQSDMLEVVSNALFEFNTAMEELNLSDCVTTFSVSEFGRTLTSNGNGTDHAWGGNVMMMGGAVQGGQIYGQYPSLALESSLELGGGVILPTTSADQYFAELALWFGVPPSDLTYLFPNISNFYSPGSGSPLGILTV